jgi:hypothetical protein
VTSRLTNHRPMRIKLEVVLPLMSQSRLQLSRAAPRLLYFCKMFAVKYTRQICRSGAGPVLLSNKKAETLED